MSIRPTLETRAAQQTMEGAGVKLHRAFGFQDPSELDPFLLFDDFRNERPQDFEKGFPWHPHRGIETITYVLEGLHQEMPNGNAKGQMHGFQLWGNLPSAQKMTAPRYQDVTAKDIPVVTDDDGTTVRVITGEFWGKRGPVDGIAADPQYLDITVPAGVRKTFRIDTYRRAFAYVFQGAAAFADASAPSGVLLEKEVGGEEVNIRDLSGDRTLIRFGTGDEVTMQAGPEGVRFLLISGAPIDEPVAWHGPIVMNTQEELRQAMRDLNNGTFIKPAH